MKGQALGFAAVVWLALLELAAPVSVVALAPLFYWRLLATSPDDVATLQSGDITELHYPYRRWVAEQFARGDHAFWNPFVGIGQSAIGDIQFHVLYPPDALLARFFGGAFDLRALEIGIIAHVALGALFTYLLARRLTRSRVGGLVGGIVFAFGGYLAGFPVQQMILLETSIWLPLILLCIDIGCDRNLVTPFVVAAGALAMAALAGHPQTLFYVMFGTVLYLAFKGWNGGRVRLAALPGLPILLGGGLALAAAALVPAYLHLGLTDRTGVGWDFSSTGFGLRELVGMVYPLEFGGAPLYNGIFTLVLAAIGLATAYARADKRFWLGFGVLGLLFSFGGNTFLGTIPYLALGAFKFRDHERLSFFVSLALAILAAYGAAELARRDSPRLDWLRRALRWAFLIVLGFLVLLMVERTMPPGNGMFSILEAGDHVAYVGLILALGGAILLGRERGFLRPGAAGLLVVFLVGFDVFTVKWQTNLQLVDPDQLVAPTPIVSYLQNYGSGLFRISSEGLLPGDGNAGMLFRLDDLVINSPLETSDYAAFDQKVDEWTRWQILNVRYVITTRTLDDPRLHLLLQDGKSNLYEIDPAYQLPRAFVVQQVVLAPDHPLALSLVNQIDPRTTAVVEGATPSGILPSLITTNPTPPATGKPPALTSWVSLSGDDSSGLLATVNLSQPGFLVVGDADYPGWEARLDGQPVPLYRADGLVRGVLVPAGSHQVTFAFVPPGLATGDALSADAQALLRDVVVLEVALYAIWFAARLGLRLRRRSVKVRTGLNGRVAERPGSEDSGEGAGLPPPPTSSPTMGGGD